MGDGARQRWPVTVTTVAATRSDRNRAGNVEQCPGMFGEHEPSLATGNRIRCSELHCVRRSEPTEAGVHNRTDNGGPVGDDRGHRGRVPAGIKTMFSTIAVLVAAGGALLLYNARVAGRVHPASLGWMSAQWLAEHRASHPS